MTRHSMDMPVDAIAEIDNLFANFHGAWERGDAAAYADLFWEDAQFVGAPGFRLNGREVIMREHKEMFETMFRGSTIDGKYDRTVQRLSPDVAVVHSLGNVFFPGQSTQTSAPTGLTTFILVRKNGVWKIMHFQNTPTGRFRALKFIARYLVSRVYLLVSSQSR